MFSTLASSLNYLPSLRSLTGSSRSYDDDDIEQQRVVRNDTRYPRYTSAPPHDSASPHASPRALDVTQLDSFHPRSSSTSHDSCHLSLPASDAWQNLKSSPVLSPAPLYPLSFSTSFSSVLEDASDLSHTPPMHSSRFPSEHCLN